MLYRNRVGENITFPWLYTIRSIINNCVLIHLVDRNTNNQMNQKWLRFTYVMYICDRTHFPYRHNWITIHTHVSPILVLSNIQWHFRARLSSAPENIVQRWTVTIYKTTNKRTSHSIINLYTLVWFNVYIYFQTVSSTIKYCTKQKCHNLHNYTHARFTRNNALLHTKTNLHQYELIQKYIQSNCINFPLGHIIIKTIQT